MREFVNKHGVVLACAAIVLAALMFWLLRSTPPTVTAAKLSYYIDESNNKESVEPVTEVPPLPSKVDGKPTVVEVVKISCEDGKNPRVAYYQKYAPDQQKRLIELSQLPKAANFVEFHNRDMEKAQLEATGLWIRKPEAGPNGWVLKGSQEGQQIVNDANKCGGEDQVARRVFP